MTEAHKGREDDTDELSIDRSIGESHAGDNFTQRWISNFTAERAESLKLDSFALFHAFLS